MATLAGAMRACAEDRVDRWLKRRPGAILEIDREMTAVTFDILSATLFSNAIADESTVCPLARATASISRMIDPRQSVHVPKTSKTSALIESAAIGRQLIVPTDNASRC